jgi:hypothetical protein
MLIPKKLIMKKTFHIMLSLLFLFCISLSVSSQSSQNDLDQVKLLQKINGTWKAEIGKDTIVIAEGVSSGNGIVTHLEWKAQGKTYATAEVIIGFTEDYESIVFCSLWNNGIVTKDIGRFVSPTKVMLERYNVDHYQAVAISTLEFQNPDTYTWTIDMRGTEITWEPLWSNKWTWTKVKE